MPKKSRDTTLYVCENCGEEYLQWQGKCDNCGQWNTLKEFKAGGESRYDAPQALGGGYSGAATAEAVSLSEIAGQKEARVPSGFGEVDRVLGGGIVAGSVILLGGDPGIGKSTLLLQVVERMGLKSEKAILYVSGEESPEQIKVRAERIGATSGKVKVLAATDVERIQGTIEAEVPGLVVIDSIQTMYDPHFPSTPGSVVQVRESAIRIQHTAKRLKVPIILVGHITKEGTVAGPRTLEHLVDVVLYLEGEPNQSLRIVRAVKNRFGDITETGIFSMEGEGMVEVENPAGFLLQERVQAPGSVLSAVVEGTRPMLVEIQALTTKSVFGYPKRTASGFDLNRLNLLLAVLQRRAGIDVSDQDVFVNVVGGLKVKDPGVDAAVCLAVASAFRDRALPGRLCAMGEVGLAGEIRRVSGHDRRVKEIEKLGYEVAGGAKDLRGLVRAQLH